MGATARQVRRSVLGEALLVGLGASVLGVLAGIGLFVVTPGAPMDWAYAGKIVGGVALALAVGELLIRQAARRRGVMSLRGAYG
nr:FtsX-like permease family protein [Acinetobacter baumannii]